MPGKSLQGGPTHTRRIFPLHITSSSSNPGLGLDWSMMVYIRADVEGIRCRHRPPMNTTDILGCPLLSSRLQWGRITVAVAHLYRITGQLSPRNGHR